MNMSGSRLRARLSKTYNLYMTHVTSSFARQHWAQTVEQARKAPITITDHGRETVAIMDAELGRRALRALEDAEDAASAAAAEAEIAAGEPTVSLDDVARELGIEIG